MSSHFRSAKVDSTHYLEKPCRDFYYDHHYFCDGFIKRLDRIEYDYLPLSLYQNIKVYIKCQILYFLYQNPHMQFTQAEILVPIVDYISAKTKRYSQRVIWREIGGDQLWILSAAGYVMKLKDKNSEQVKYYSNIKYDKIFDYNLLGHPFIILQMENNHHGIFSLSKIMKFVKLFEILQDGRPLSAVEIINSGFAASKVSLVRDFLNPLIKVGLMERIAGSFNNAVFYRLTHLFTNSD